MNKLEVGMYVRTRKGKISRIINKYDNSGSLHEKNIVWVLDDTSVLALHSQKVIKSSYNIIDLIEVGDYVNGVKVTSAEPVFDGDTDRYLGFGNYDYYIHNSEDIKSIVTKEMYSSVEYRVENN